MVHEIFIVRLDCFKKKYQYNKKHACDAKKKYCLSTLSCPHHDQLGEDQSVTFVIVSKWLHEFMQHTWMFNMNKK